MTSEASTAAHASGILQELISQFVDQRSLLVGESQCSEDGGHETTKARALISICTIFEDALSTCKGLPNEHLLDVISALFLKLGMYILMIHMNFLFIRDSHNYYIAISLLLLLLLVEY